MILFSSLQIMHILKVQTQQMCIKNMEIVFKICWEKAQQKPFILEKALKMQNSKLCLCTNEPQKI